jgi:hypothetical protein
VGLSRNKVAVGESAAGSPPKQHTNVCYKVSVLKIRSKKSIDWKSKNCHVNTPDLSPGTHKSKIRGPYETTRTGS